MQVHRTRHPSAFTTLPNAILRHPRLSLSARGLLGHLLSLPNGSHETIQTISDKVEEGRLRVRKAMGQLEAEGYIWRIKRQDRETGLWATELHVSDVPMTEQPSDQAPAAGEPKCQPFGHSPKGERNQGKNPPTPEVSPEDTPAEPEGGREEAPQEHNNELTEQAAAILNRIGQKERRLRLGVPETMKLAPLAAEWLVRGASERDIQAALTLGLPDEVRVPAKVVSWRLTNKMPAVPAPVEPVVPLVECAECGTWLPRGQQAGICGRCAGVAQAPANSGDSTRTISGEAGNLLAAIRDRRATGAFSPKAKPYNFRTA